MSCPDCLTVRCRWHSRSTKVLKVRGLTLSRALTFWAARKWLNEWRRAERRLRAARSERRSVQAKITQRRKRGLGSMSGYRFSPRLFAADREFKLAERDVANQQAKFARLMRSLVEGR